MPLKTLTVSTTTPRTLPLEVSAIAFSPPMTSFDHGVKYAAAAARLPLSADRNVPAVPPVKQGFDGCEAITFSLADGAAAGQDVPHTHLQVVPRRTGDGLGWRATGQLEDRETLDAIASQLRTALGRS